MADGAGRYAFLCDAEVHPDKVAGVMSELKVIRGRLPEALAKGFQVCNQSVSTPGTYGNTWTHNEVTISLADGPETEAPCGKARTHTCREGDTLAGIARRYGIRVEDLRRINQL